MAEKKYEERDQFPTLIDGGQVDEAIVNTPPTEKGVFNTGITSTQIEQVVDLPVPTTDDEGKVLKVDAEGKWELSTDAEGTVVVANPTLAGTEADLVGLQVGATKYKVPQGMQLLELSAASGTLTNEQYALADGNNCVIKYEGHYYYKYDKAGTTLSYTSIHPMGNYGTENFVNGTQYTVDINTSTKIYNALSKGVIISKVIANPTLAGTESALTGLQVGDTKYKVGAESPIAYEGTSLLPTDVVFTDWSLHRAIKDGNMLWIVLTASITNNTSGSQSISDIFSLTLPSGISSKIYRQDGTTCNDAYSSNPYITYFSGNKDSSNGAFIFQSLSANSFTLSMGSPFSLGNGSSVRLYVRIPLFLDIGTVAS